jgi:hypothetical protein
MVRDIRKLKLISPLGFAAFCTKCLLVMFCALSASAVPVKLPKPKVPAPKPPTPVQVSTSGIPASIPLTDLLQQKGR